MLPAGHTVEHADASCIAAMHPMTAANTGARRLPSERTLSLASMLLSLPCLCMHNEN
jgi:hypothetical protein